MIDWLIDRSIDRLNALLIGLLSELTDSFGFYVLTMFQAIKDLHLLGIVAGLLAVDVIFLSCWIAVDPLEAEVLKFEELVSVNLTSSLSHATLLPFLLA